MVGQDDIAVQIGRNIRRIRKAKGLRQSAVSRAVGISHQQFLKYEKGENRISVERLLEIARLFGTPIVSFLPAESTVEGTSLSKNLFDCWMEVEALPCEKRDQFTNAMREVLRLIDP